MEDKDYLKRYKPEVLKKLHTVQLKMLKDFSEVCDKYEIPYFVVYGTAIGAVRHHGFIPWDDDIDVAMLREDYNKFFEIFENEMGDEYKLLTPQIDGRYACTVTHIQRKGTRFVSEMSKDLKCEQCIFMDIFPFDKVANDDRKASSQGKMANFFGKMLFLSGTANPVIKYGGMKKRIAQLACSTIHIVLKICHITPRILYKRYLSVATAYNNDKACEYVTSFEYTGCLKDKVKAKELFPVKKVVFEDLIVNIPANNDELLKKIYGDYMKMPPEAERVNHMPLIIQFEGEEPIYESK